MFSRLKVIVLTVDKQTNRQTDRQTPLKIFNAVRYTTTLDRAKNKAHD